MTATVVSIDEANARRRQERIRLMASTVREGIDKIGALVDEAKASNDHVALGYPSWTAYLTDTLGSEPLRLDRDKRREVVALLSGEGMSTRAIAPIVGASLGTVHADRQVFRTEHLDSGVDDMPEGDYMAATANATENQFEAALAGARASGDLSRANVVAHLPESVKRADLPPFNPTTGELLGDVDTADVIDPAPKRTTGLDGKSYPKPTPTKPRRKPLTDSARDAGWELRKAVERLTRVAEDDRFRSNANEVATSLRGHLIYAAEVCQDLLDRLPSPEKEN